MKSKATEICAWNTKGTAMPQKYLCNQLYLLQSTAACHLYLHQATPALVRPLSTSVAVHSSFQNWSKQQDWDNLDSSGSSLDVACLGRVQQIDGHRVLY